MLMASKNNLPSKFENSISAINFLFKMAFFRRAFKIPASESVRNSAELSFSELKKKIFNWFPHFESNDLVFPLGIVVNLVSKEITSLQGTREYDLTGPEED